MAKDPAVLFYTSDFLIGVADMPFLERGYYITLLCLQHQKGHLSEESICFALGLNSVSQIPKVMEKFDKDKNGLYYQHRMETEGRKRAAFTESRRKNGEKGGRPPREQAESKNHVDNHMDNHMEDENENENEIKNTNEKEIEKKIEKKQDLQSERFDEFWAAYPKKVGKGAARKSWMKIKPTKELFNKILSAVEVAKKSKQWQKENGQYIPNPSTWLNQGRWDDELSVNIQSNGKAKNVSFADIARGLGDEH
ncbi:MAG: hypothetical protein K9L62_00270 [Vallitaleaceae bacterium]|nr:hypothetical protein [Vallitaleaceae bacterium]